MLRPALALAALCLSTAAWAGDWASWRGPAQDGTSPETGLVSTLSAEGTNLLWSVDLPGGGTPVVWGDRVYAWGFRRGAGQDAWEVLAAFDLATGKPLWEQPFRDFLSDIVYERYSIGAPAVDRETGNIYVQSSAGEVLAFAPDGRRLWTVSMMDAWGRLTFPNGRTGALVIDEDRVLVHGITASWGREGPGRDRFYAFDKRTGEALWSSTPGTQPRDSSWSTPLVLDLQGRHTAITGTGCGQVIAIDARTGEGLWRFPMSDGGVNHTVVTDGSVVIAAHNVENLDSTVTGRIVAIDLAGERVPAEEGAPVLKAERWRRDLAGFSSSPILHSGLVYFVTPTGELMALDALTGADVWSVKLGPDQLHASPVLADGRLWVPMFDGTFAVVKAGREGGQVLASTKLAGRALGAPAIVDGRILVHSSEKLYAFGEARPIAAVQAAAPTPLSKAPAVSARVRPAEVLLRPGERQALTVELLDAEGRVVERVPAEAAESFVPATAKVVSRMNATFEKGALVAPADAGLTAGAWKVTAKGFEGTTRGRTVSGVPFAEDFETIPVDQVAKDGTAFGWPPLPWIGARFKWQVQERDGSHVLAKTIDNMLFQRATTFLGHPEERGYVIAADLLTDGNRRGMSAMGLINSRYLVALKGNQRNLELSSNQDRLKISVPFLTEPGVWYRLVLSVQAGSDGFTTVRAKVWKRGEPEPAAWTLDVRHEKGHTMGAPGVFGFTPSNQHRVYVDHLTLTKLGEAL